MKTTKKKKQNLRRQVSALRRLPAIGTLLLFLAAGWLPSGCTVAEVEEAPHPLVEVDFAAPLLLVVSPDADVTYTRTLLKENLPIGATVRVAAYLRDPATSVQVHIESTAPSAQATYEVQPGGSLVPCTVDANGRKTTGPATRLGVRAGTYDFYAISPARPLTQPGNYRVEGLLHHEDVMTSYKRNVPLTAYVTGTNGNTGNTGNKVGLETFKRRSAELVFTVKAESQSGIVKLRGIGLKLEKISSAPAAITVGEDRNIAPTGGSRDPGTELEFIAADFKPITQPQPNDPQGLNEVRTIVLPKNNSAFDLAISVERDHEAAILRTTIDNIAFDPGKRYKFELEVKKSESILTMYVLDWNSKTDTPPPVGKPDGPVPEPEIGRGTAITIIVARWNNIVWSGNGSVGHSRPILTINEQLLKSYKSAVAGVGSRPPFNQEGTNRFYGTTPDVAAGTMTGFYLIQVERGQKDERPTYTEAQSHCAALREDGRSDWRIPSAIELYAIYKNRATIESFFGSKPFSTRYYWSSTVYDGDNNRRMIPQFSSGNLGYVKGITTSGSTMDVRCVRNY